VSYFYDTGLVCSLLGIQNKNQLATHYLKGGLFESFILSEIIKYRLNKGAEPDCYYWRDKIGNEVDCIITINDSLVVVEIKSGKTITDDFFDGLKYWNSLAGNKNKRAYLIYNGAENQKRTFTNVVGWKDIISIFNRQKTLTYRL
jgi:predicted AAA+ superfamily ATPase